MISAPAPSADPSAAWRGTHTWWARSGLMAVSFFAFVALLSVAESEFRRSGDRGELCARDHPGPLRLEGADQAEALGRRRAGGLRRGSGRPVILVLLRGRGRRGISTAGAGGCPAASGQEGPRPFGPAARLDPEAGSRARSALPGGHSIPRGAGLSGVRGPVRGG